MVLGISQFVMVNIRCIYFRIVPTRSDVNRKIDTNKYFHIKCVGKNLHDNHFSILPLMNGRYRMSKRSKMIAEDICIDFVFFFKYDGEFKTVAHPTQKPVEFQSSTFQ